MARASRDGRSVFHAVRLEMGSHWFTDAHGLEFAELEARIARACRGVRGVDVDDLKQQTYLDLLELHKNERDKFAKKEEVLHYAARCALYLSWRTARKQKRGEGVGIGIDMDGFPARDHGPQEPPLGRLRALLADCAQSAALLARYPDQLREVYFRRCNKEPRDDVAKALGISGETVRRREIAAWKLLRREIESDKDKWGLE